MTADAWLLDLFNLSPFPVFAVYTESSFGLWGSCPQSPWRHFRKKKRKQKNRVCPFCFIQLKPPPYCPKTFFYTIPYHTIPTVKLRSYSFELWMYVRFSILHILQMCMIHGNGIPSTFYSLASRYCTRMQNALTHFIRIGYVYLFLLLKSFVALCDWYDPRVAFTDQETIK